MKAIVVFAGLFLLPALIALEKNEDQPNGLIYDGPAPKFILQVCGLFLRGLESIKVVNGISVFKPNRDVDRVRIPVTFSLHCSP